MLLLTRLYPALAEMIGTFAVISVGGGSILLSERYPHIFPSVGIAITFGTVIALMILAVGHVSGAHFNPAVTLAFAVTKRLPAAQAPVYWLSQGIGAVIAAILLIHLKSV